MIKHIEHSVGTVELAKKLNEVIRIMNEGNPNTLPFDVNLLLNKIEGYGFACKQDYYGSKSVAMFQEIRGMLGLK